MTTGPNPRPDISIVLFQSLLNFKISDDLVPYCTSKTSRASLIKSLALRRKRRHPTIKLKASSDTWASFNTSQPCLKPNPSSRRFILHLLRNVQSTNTQPVHGKAPFRTTERQPQSHRHTTGLRRKPLPLHLFFAILSQFSHCSSNNLHFPRC